MQQNELTESVIYEKIAAFAKGEENRQTLLRLAREEKAHYQIWKTYTGEEMNPEQGKVLKFWKCITIAQAQKFLLGLLLAVNTKK